MVDVVACVPARRDRFRFINVNILDIWLEFMSVRPPGSTFEFDFPEMLAAMYVTAVVVPAVD